MFIPMLLVLCSCNQPFVTCVLIILHGCLLRHLLWQSFLLESHHRLHSETWHITQNSLTSILCRQTWLPDKVNFRPPGYWTWVNKSSQLPGPMLRPKTAILEQLNTRKHRLTRLSLETARVTHPLYSSAFLVDNTCMRLTAAVTTPYNR